MATKGLTKVQLVEHLSERLGLSRAQVSDMLDELQSVSVRELQRSGEFVVPGIGKLVVTTRKARAGRNPATGDAIRIPARDVVTARLSRQLRDLLSDADVRYRDLEITSEASGLEGDSEPPKRPDEDE